MHAPIRSLLKILVLSAVILCWMHSVNAIGQTATDRQSTRSTFHMRSYVMGSGGIRSQSSQYQLLATAGEGTMGATSSPNHYFKVGYWNSHLTGVTVSVPIMQDDQNPEIIRLYQNYPNPFNPQTTFVYDLRKEATVHAAIYNSVGQLIRHFKTEIKPAGQHSLLWDARDDAGRMAGSGVYIFHFTAAEETSTDAASTVAFQKSIKILLLK